MKNFRKEFTTYIHKFTHLHSINYPKHTWIVVIVTCKISTIFTTITTTPAIIDHNSILDWTINSITVTPLYVRYATCCYIARQETLCSSSRCLFLLHKHQPISTLVCRSPLPHVVVAASLPSDTGSNMLLYTHM